MHYNWIALSLRQAPSMSAVVPRVSRPLPSSPPFPSETFTRRERGVVNQLSCQACCACPPSGSRSSHLDSFETWDMEMASVMPMLMLMIWSHYYPVKPGDGEPPQGHSFILLSFSPLKKHGSPCRDVAHWVSPPLDSQSGKKERKNFAKILASHLNSCDTKKRRIFTSLNIHEPIIIITIIHVCILMMMSRPIQNVHWFLSREREMNLLGSSFSD